MADGADDTREVVRTIRLPTSVSDEARRVLALGNRFASMQLPDADKSPTDVAGWQDVMRVSEASLTKMLEARNVGLPPMSIDLRDAGGVPMYVITPDQIDTGYEDATYYFIHGGGLIAGRGENCRLMAMPEAGNLRMETWSPDYRMVPEFPYPASLDDCIQGYRSLLERRSPDRVVVGGASGGGNLAAALILRARDEGLPLPRALVLISPEVDLTDSGDSFQTLDGIDFRKSLAAVNRLYAGEHDLQHPYISPLFGDLRAPFPPTFLQAGTRDTFLSNAVRMHQSLRAEDLDSQLYVSEAMPHGGFGGHSPEDRAVEQEVRRFVAARMATPS